MAENTRCGVIIVGDEPLTVQCADLAVAAGTDVAAIVTASPVVAELASDRSIPVVRPGDEVAALGGRRLDALFSIANLRMLPADVLAMAPIAINYHDGPLPSYAGLNVTSWALLNGEREHAITWHLMTSDVDGGEIVVSERFPIADDETAFSLNARCYEVALGTFPAVVAAVVAGDVRTRPQEPGERRQYRRHDRPAVLIDPNAAARDIVRGVRALDVGPRWHNTLGVARLVIDDAVAVVHGADVIADGSAPAGTIVSVGPDHVRIGSGGGGDVRLERISDGRGDLLDVSAWLANLGRRVGDVLPPVPSALRSGLVEHERAIAPHERFWLSRATAEPTRPMFGETGRTWSSARADVAATADDVLAAVVVWLARTTAADQVTIGLVDAEQRQLLERTRPLTRVGSSTFEVDTEASFAAVRAAVAAERAAVAGRGVLLHDAIGRDPDLRDRASTPPLVLVDVEGGPDLGAVAGADGEVMRIGLVDGALAVSVADPDAAERCVAQLAALSAAGAAEPDQPAARLPLVTATERALLDEVNATAVDHDRTATIDSLLRNQISSTPDAPALSASGTTYSYAELGRAVDDYAAILAAAGVGRGDRVGIAVERGMAMVVAVLATLRRGAAYVPLDPGYPLDRLWFMIDDAGLAAVVARPDTAARLDRPAVAVVAPWRQEHPGVEPVASEPPRPEDLAYVIYTSGSTGTPKGVMLEHRQVVNFFVAMDAVIDHDPPGVWLALTSLSFDISVLELLWTLTRGFHVVVKADSGFGGPSATPVRPTTFSLFYFAAGDDGASSTYGLLLDSARFADTNGFEAVWTPERHFHAFGAAYPNPSVTGAALAAITEHVAIRAGSVVLPLHSPVRVAEEWSVVDNLSNGRVGISFAAGWQRNDFVLNPSSFADAKEALPGAIDIVRRLWRGERVSLPGPDGDDIAVATLPRPVQDELPVWLTSAGTPATFERAGRLGTNVLTHLLGQSVEQLAGNIERYRAARREAGHGGDGRVTLMLHTYLDPDAATSRERAREPMKRYLGTAVGLLRDVASAFPTFANAGRDADEAFRNITPDELDQLLDFAADRYLGTSGLFGTPDDAVRMVEQLSAAGVDEVACLIDFGVPTEQVMDSLPCLLEVKQRITARVHDVPPEPVAGDRVHELVARYGVTHLQCTPSLATMLLADPHDGSSLSQIGHLMLGGEALPVALARELRGRLRGRFTNMYGPTETTIWSLVHELASIDGSVPIGRPIANTTIAVLDPGGEPLPFGAFGELHIGGEGVARGYHGRAELTAERFRERPGLGRAYATGDLVRLRADGLVEFAGRADNQVKIRGHRIELGEIESVIDGHPDVVQSVVVARTDRGDTRLVAFVVLAPAATVSMDELRQLVADTLPDAMVPSVVAALAELPLTPNGKVDRRALPAEIRVPAEAVVTGAPPAGDQEEMVAQIWAEELGRPVGRDDNFFDIGGHSLLAVKVFRRLADATGASLSLTDVFRFPTVRTFSAHLLADPDAASPASAGPTGTDRGALRRRAMGRRGANASE